MGQTKFQTSWKSKYDWVEKSSKSKYNAVCLPCGKDLSVKAGVNVLDRHQETDKHKDNYKKYQTQSVFKSNNNQVSIEVPQKPSSSRVLTSEEQILRAEIIRCLDIVNTNSPFSASENDNSKYRNMFTDSDIAKGYSQGADKVKYMVQFGIAPIIRDIILDDLRGKPFSFRFDETTTSQVKKQYDGYATFYSDHFNQMITAYLGTLFVGKCTADDILNDLNIMMRKLELDIDYIVALGMDGPNVNLSFFEKLSDLFAIKGKELIDVGTCSLHTVANAFGKGLKQLAAEEMNLDEFAVNLHSFFKLSAKRIEEYFTTDILTELEPQRMIRHAETRWLGIQRVLLRIMEQLPNIQKYFLKIVPADKKSFNGKNGVGSSTRYVSIKKMLTDERLRTVMSAVTFVAQEFKSYVVPLQSRSPLITVLFTKMQKLLQGLLSLFIKEKKFLKNNKLRQISKIQELDLSDTDNHKAKCELGSKYAKELALLKSPLEQKKMDDLMKAFLITLCSYLLGNLPLDKQVLRDVRVIHPNWPLDGDKCPDAIARLASTLWNALGQSKMIDLFKLKPLATKCEFVDIIKKEFSSFRLESVPENIIEEKSKSSAQLKPSYWRRCYDLAGLNPPDVDEGYTVDAEVYWTKVMGLCDVDGNEKYWHLGLLAVCILLLPHGNADPERGFSVNKRLLEKHGFNTGEETLEALRVIKDYLIQIGGPEHVKINQKMLASCASSRQKYQHFLDAKAKRNKEEAKKKEEDKVAEKKRETAEEIDSRVSTIQVKLKLTDAMIEEGNKLLKACVQKMVHSVFKEGQEKVELGVKRKAELNQELENLMAKKSKL